MTGITITRGPAETKKAPHIKPRQVPAAAVHQGACAKAENLRRWREVQAKRKATTGEGA